MQDTTELDFSHREAVAGLGPIHTRENPGQGMFLHSTLAVDEAGTPLGFLGLQTWTRDAAEMGKREKRRKKPIEEKVRAWSGGARRLEPERGGGREAFMGSHEKPCGGRRVYDQGVR